MIAQNAPLDMTDPAAPAFLSAIQGNILKGHARDHAVHLFIRFNSDATAPRQWVRHFGLNRVTSALEHHQQISSFKSSGDGGTFASLALSNNGYEALGIPLASRPADQSFRLGMKKARQERDPAPSTWEPGFQGEIDSLVILADQNSTRLAAAVSEVQATLAGIAEIVQIERGDVIVRDDPQAGRINIIHFGFADGISQPLAIKQDAEREIKLRGKSFWDPTAPLSLLLEADSAGAFGSYFVFRKLEQDVRGFMDAEQTIGKLLGLPEDEMYRVEGMVVGRRRNGYSAIQSAPEPSGAPGNDFNFTDDRFGLVCPYHAHIRRTNPRGDLASPTSNRPALPFANERAFRVARRGIPYGDAQYLSTGAPPPSSRVGLLFMCAQASLKQFQTLQDGSDDNDFPTPGIGVDAAIGRNATPRPQRWQHPQDLTVAPETKLVDGAINYAMANFVTLRGGEYFFLPSMPFFSGL